MPIMEVALPFIQTNKDGKMSVNEDLIPIISQFKDSVAVIAITGKHRTGKSYIMNWFFNTSSSNVEYSTEGIWMWARPHPLDPQCTLILLDTEGLHGVEKGDEAHDMKLFSLALLLSNCLVYNTMGTLDNVITQQLHLLTNLTEHIKTVEGQEEDKSNFKKYFPSFFLLLRDFCPDPQLEGRECSPAEYMENALKLKLVQSTKVTDHNIPSQCLWAFFPHRRFFTLCKPVEDDAKLRMPDGLNESHLKQEFLKKTKEITDALLKEAKPLNVDGIPINGPRFVALAQMYVNVLNDGAIPCISSVLDVLSNNECERVMDEAVALFENRMVKQLENKMPVEDHILCDIQKAAHEVALEHYHQQCAPFDRDKMTLNKLLATLENSYKDQITLNNIASTKKCEAVLAQCFSIVESQIQVGGYTGKGSYQHYKTDKETAVQKYQNTPNKGPMAANVLSQFLDERSSQEKTIVNMDKTIGEEDKELAIEIQQQKNEEQHARATEANLWRKAQDLMRKQIEHKQIMAKIYKDFHNGHGMIIKEHMKGRKGLDAEHFLLLSEKMKTQAVQHQKLMDDMGKKHRLKAPVTMVTDHSSDKKEEKIDRKEKEAENQLLRSEKIKAQPIQHHKLTEEQDLKAQKLKNQAELAKWMNPTEYGPYGGYNGRYFTDRQTSYQGNITAIIIRAGDIIDGIQLRYGDYWAAHHGGWGGGEHFIFLDDGELIKSIEIMHGFSCSTYGNVISRIKFVTTAHTYGWYGKLEKGCKKAIVNCDSSGPSYIFGRAHRFLVQLNIVVDCNCPWTLM